MHLEAAVSKAVTQGACPCVSRPASSRRHSQSRRTRETGRQPQVDHSGQADGEGQTVARQPAVDMEELFNDDADLLPMHGTGDQQTSAQVQSIESPSSKELDDEEQADTYGDSWDDNIDDPVRIYLMQMGEIPLLNRKEEVDAAKKIERARTLYRRSLLANDFILQGRRDALEEGSRRRTAARPHDRSLGDRRRGEKADLEPAQTEPENAGAPAAAQSPRLLLRAEQEVIRWPNVGRRGIGLSSVGTRPCDWSKN
ncbi:MAG: sigma-70 factor domain-containing protein [Pirellulales bacterium]